MINSKDVEKILKEKAGEINCPQMKLNMNEGIYEYRHAAQAKKVFKFNRFFGRAVAAVLCMCLIATGLYVNFFMGQYNVDDVTDYFLVDKDKLKLEPHEEVDLAQLPPYALTQGETVSDSEVINILLVGSDSWSIKERGRSDSMMIATVDMKNKELKLTSFLRDSWVFIPGTDNKGQKYEWNRINTSYGYGDAKLLMETIEYNFNIKLDKYVVVNFNVFRDIIDTIDGIDVNLSAEEAEYLRGRSEAEGGPNRSKVEEGMNTLDGPLALEFARARKAGPFTYTNNEGETVEVGYDFARTARQRYVIESIFNKMKDESITKLLAIAEDCLKNTRTNITITELASYLNAVLSIETSEISQLQIPAAGKYENKKMPSGAAVLYLSEQNMQENSNILKEFIFE